MRLLTARLMELFKRFLNHKYLPTVFVSLMLVIGISLLVYPDVAQWWNGRNQRGMVALYDEQVAQMRAEEIEAHFRRAEEVNAALSQLSPAEPLLVATLASPPYDYFSILYLVGMMGRLQIPVIGVDLPIYHGTHTAALDRGVGHMEGTSFPIGGESTHSVLTAHTGLPNARMFTDMEGNVRIGDQFFIDILGRRLAYEVDDIRVIQPHEVESMRIIPGQDFVTLMTCTPYTINSHRLLVRGRRIEYIPYMAEEIEQAIEETRFDVRIYVFVAFFLLFMLGFAIYNALSSKRQTRRPARPAIRPAPSYEPEHEPIYEPEVPAAAAYNNYNDYVPIEDLYDSYNDTARPQPYSSYSTTGLHEEFRPYDRDMPAPADRWPAREDMAAPIEYSRMPNQKAAGFGAAAARPTSKSIRPSRSSRSTRRRSTAMPNMTRNIAACLIALIVITGAGIAAAQVIGPNGNGRNSQTAIEDFVSRIEAYNSSYRDRWVAEQLNRWLEDGEIDIQDTPSENPLSWLHERIAEYNRHLYEQNHSVPDPFDDNQDQAQDSFNLSYFGFDDEEMIGFITIPSLDKELPIFMGANRQNLRRGAAHVTGSSLPIGGPSTNAVLGVHLGHTNLSVEELIHGDEIRVTNFYETITYTIIDILNTGSIPGYAMGIHSGRDNLTILGYRPGSPERYIVIATRAH